MRVLNLSKDVLKRLLVDTIKALEAAKCPNEHVHEIYFKDGRECSWCSEVQELKEITKDLYE